MSLPHMSQIYAIFTDQTGGDNPSTLHYLGTNMNTVDLTRIKDAIGEWESTMLVYVCKFKLIEGGLNLDSHLVGFNAEPALIEEHKIFKGSFTLFKEYMERL